MDTEILRKAETYYKAVGARDLEAAIQYLHSDVEFIGPMATLKGKEAVTEAVRRFIEMFKSLTIQAKFASADQAVVIYHVDIPGVSNDFPGASWMTFRDGLIVRIQLFYDARKFQDMQKQIFAKT